MSAELDEINSIIAIADAMQERLDALEKRKTVSVSQHVAIRACAGTVRGFRGYDLAQLRILFDPEYAEEMNNLTRLSKGS